MELALDRKLDFRGYIDHFYFYFKRLDFYPGVYTLYRPHDERERWGLLQGVREETMV